MARQSEGTLPAGSALTGLLFRLDELGEPARFLQDGFGVASVGVIILHQHRNHVGSEFVRLAGENVTEALLLIVAQDDNGLLVLCFGDQFLDLLL